MLTSDQLQAIRARYDARTQPFSRFDDWRRHMTDLADTVPVLLDEIERLRGREAAHQYAETIAAYSEAWIS